jgi:hypothetical protein
LEETSYCCILRALTILQKQLYSFDLVLQQMECCIGLDKKYHLTIENFFASMFLGRNKSGFSRSLSLSRFGQSSKIDLTLKKQL